MSPAKFNGEKFIFSDDDTIPEHIDADPSNEERDLRKFSIEERDGKTGFTPIAIDVNDHATALMLYKARRRLIEAGRLPDEKEPSKQATRMLYPQ